MPGAGLENFGRLRMSAGEFVEVYGGAGQGARFDSCVTCFFLDTAHNVLRYLEVISHVLKVCLLSLAGCRGTHKCLASAPLHQGLLPDCTSHGMARVFQCLLCFGLSPKV